MADYMKKLVIFYPFKYKIKADNGYYNAEPENQFFNHFFPPFLISLMLKGLITSKSFFENLSYFLIPHLWRRYWPMTLSVARPYCTDLEKLMEDASLKYLVGTGTSEDAKPFISTWAMTSVSKTKSSEFRVKGMVVRSF